MKRAILTSGVISMFLVAIASAQQAVAEFVAVESDHILSVAFSPDGRWVAGGGFDRTVKLWTSRNWTIERTLTGSRQSVRVVTFSPDSRIVVAACDDGVVRLWDVETGELAHTIDSGVYHLSRLAWSPNGKWLAGSAIKGAAGKIVGTSVRLWDAATGELIREHEVAGGFVSYGSFSPDSSRLAAGGAVVHVWDTASGVLLSTLTAGRGSCAHVVFPPDGKRLIAGGGYRSDGNRVAGQITGWDAESGKLITTFDFPEVEHSTSVRSLAISPDGKIVASGGSGRSEVRDNGLHIVLRSELRLWDAESGKLLRTYEGDLGDVGSLSFSPEGKWIVLSDGDSVQLVDVASGQLQERLLKYTRRPIK